MQELLEQVKVVAEARQRALKALEAKNAARLKWESENRALLDEATLTAALVASEESKLRDLTLQAYHETGNKAPAPGVGVREVIRLDYDPKEALKWATEHQIALSLDKKSFEGFAKATPLEFVKVTQEPQAIIAQDLSKVLEVK